MSLPKIEIQIVVPASTSIAIVETPAATATVTLTAGNYYLTTLLAHIAAALTGNSTLAGTYSCSLADETGLPTVSVTGITSFAVTVVNALITAVTGLTTGSTGAATYTGASQARYLWLPNVTRTNQRAPEGDYGGIVDDGTVTVAPDGTCKGVGYAVRYTDNLEFRYLLGSKVYQSIGSTYATLEDIYNDGLRYRRPFRYYPDRATDGTYVVYRALQPANWAPMVQGWTGASSLWTWQTDVIKDV